MTELSKSELAGGAGAPVVGYVQLPKTVDVGEVFTIVSVSKNTQINDVKKFSVKDKDGVPVGWNYRFMCEDGRVWDVNKKALFGPCLTWLYPNGFEKDPTPVKVRLFRKAEKKSERESIYGVELADK